MIRAILLPGMDGTGELLAEFAYALAPKYAPTIIRYPKDDALDYQALTALVRGALPRDEPFVLIAESFSGPIAITLAAARPEGLVGLVLCASFARAPRPRLRPFMRLLQALPLRLSTLPAMPFLMGRWSSPAWLRRIRKSIRAVDAPVLHRRLHEACTVDVTALVDGIDCPLLYLKASHDRLVPTESWHAIRDASRNAVCIEIEGPHFLLQAKPQECAAAIDR